MRPKVLAMPLLVLALAGTARSGAQAPAQGAPSPETLRALLAAGDLGRLKELAAAEPSLVTAADRTGRTLLHGAAAAGQLEIMRWLVAAGAAVDAPTERRVTPLMQAAQAGQRQAMQLLLDLGAKVDARDAWERTALVRVARETGDAATLAALLAAGAAVDAADKNGDTALDLAIWRGFRPAVDLLLERGAKLPDAPAKRGGLLVLAVSKGLDQVFDRLYTPETDLAAEDEVGGTLLHAAADGGSERIAGVLLARGLDSNGVDRNGWTPLHRAAERGRLAAASLLVARGARLDARTAAGDTPYNLAVAEGNRDVAALLAAKGADTGPPRFPKLRGAYLGQKQPGDVPELFAPGIVSSRFGLHSTVAFSPDGTEAFWSVMVEPRTSGYSIGRLLTSRLQRGRWTHPEVAAFARDDDADVPFFSPDGRRLYFLSRRALPGQDGTGDEHVWYLERRGDGWAAPRPVDETVNALPHHWQISVDRRYDLYFATTVAGGRGGGDIWRSRCVDGRYAPPENLGDRVNTPANEGTPFIAPDASYLIFGRDLDLMVSFRAADGSWGEPAPLGGAINSPAPELCPIVSADGRYLFFLSGRGGESHAWWVSTRALLAARPARSPA